MRSSALSAVAAMATVTVAMSITLTWTGGCASRVETASGRRAWVESGDTCREVLRKLGRPYSTQPDKMRGAARWVYVRELEDDSGYEMTFIRFRRGRVHWVRMVAAEKPWAGPQLEGDPPCPHR